MIDRVVCSPAVAVIFRENNGTATFRSRRLDSNRHRAVADNSVRAYASYPANYLAKKYNEQEEELRKVRDNLSRWSLGAVSTRVELSKVQMTARLRDNIEKATSPRRQMQELRRIRNRARHHANRVLAAKSKRPIFKVYFEKMKTGSSDNDSNLEQNEAPFAMDGELFGFRTNITILIQVGTNSTCEV